MTRQLRALASRADTDDIDGWWRRVAEQIVALVAAAWRVIRDLTRQYLTEHAAIEGRDVDPELVEWNTEQVLTALRVTGPVAFKTAVRDGKTVSEARQVMAERLTGAGERLVLNAGRDTVAQTVAANGEIVGWRRVSDGDPCAFCAMLVSRGAVYKSARTAGDPRFGGTQYHDHDGCWAEPIYEREEEPAEVDDLYRQWLEVTAGKSGQDAIRAWRRYWDGRGQDIVTEPEREPEREPSPPEPQASPNPAVLSGSRTGGWQNAIPADTGEDRPIPVRGFEIDGYNIKSGRAYRIDGITYIIEDGTAMSHERVLREFREIHQQLPGAADYQQGYAWLAGANPADSYWAEKYRMPDFRSFATAGDGAVRIWGRANSLFGPSSHRNELKHEFGHNVSSAARSRGLDDKSDAWDEAARLDARAIRPVDFRLDHFGHPLNLTPDQSRPWPNGVTSYGTSSPGEDYAESVDLYLSAQIGVGRLVPGGPLVAIYFRDLFPARAAILDRIFPATAQAQLRLIARDRG